MAQVVVTIAGRTYRMSCEDGQERHIEALAADVDRRMNELRGNFGEIGEQRLVVMTALTISDELSDARTRIGALEARVAALETTVAGADQARVAREAGVARTIDLAAERLEAAARILAGKD